MAQEHRQTKQQNQVLDVDLLVTLVALEIEKKQIEKKIAEIRPKLGSSIEQVEPIEPVSIQPQSVEFVVSRAIEVIGDQPAALRWLGTPVRALDYATPISRLYDPQGQSEVLKVLTQLEHGVL